MHIYKKNRRDLGSFDAAVKSVPEAASSILASGLTTIGGFVALYCMRFRVGADIAGVIIKGVVMSLLTILILQPIITLLLDKAIIKTTHDFLGKINDKIRQKKPDFSGISKENIVKPIASFLVKNWQRIVLAVIAVGLLVPAFLGQSKLQYSYFQMYEVNNDTPEKVLASELGNQMIVAVPLETKVGTQYDFIEVMSCPGGCVAGAGQPQYEGWKIRKERAQGLYADDRKLAYKSQDNKDVMALYGHVLDKIGGKEAHQLLHTHYQDRQDKTGK